MMRQSACRLIDRNHQQDELLTPSLTRALVHVMSNPEWLQKRHHLGPAFGTDLGLGGFKFRHHCLFRASDGLVDNSAQQLGVAVVGDHIKAPATPQSCWSSTSFQ